MGTIRLFGVLLFCCICMPSIAIASVNASGLSVNPPFIDLEAKPRDIVKGEITLKNTTDHKIVIFPDVHDYTEKGKSSLVSWVEISRGVVEIDSGEERSVPYLIHINYDAKPDHYHGILWFGQGSFRSEAETHPEKAVEILMNVKVLDDAMERLSLATFIPDRQVFSSENATFSFGLKNTGNRVVAPSGNLRIYDRRGREIATVPVNTENKTISPDGKELLATAWASQSAFGRYKAILDLEYGGSNKAITDTTFFWVLPWGKTLSLFTGISVAVVILAIMFHARLESRRMVYAGVENPVSHRKRRTEEEAESEDALPPALVEKQSSRDRIGQNDFLKKLQRREDAKRLRTQETVLLSREERPHATHLSLLPKDLPKAPKHTPTRLTKYEHPKEDGNVVRLSRV